MSVTLVNGNLFESSAQTLTNAVNCVGVMGKGIALEFKKHHPDMFADYVRRCKLEQVRLGQPYVYKASDHPWILNFPTKHHWRSKSNLEAIVSGLEYLLAHYEEWEITSLAVPALGCGLGGLKWETTKPTLVEYLDQMTIPIKLYQPQ